MVLTKKAIFICLFLVATLNVSAQWTQQNVNVSSDFYGVSYSGSDNIFISGVSRLVTSTNGGANWSSNALQETTGNLIASSALYDSHFFDANIGIATGFITTGNSEAILRTVNGGQNWSYASVYNSGTWPRNLNDIHFSNGSDGIAVGTNGRILKTTDSGNTWSAVSSGTTNELKSVFFSSATTGFIVGENVILKTSNGGNSWTPQAFPSSSFNAVWFTSATTGFVVGESGILLRTIDGGTVWHEINTMIGGTFNDVCFVSPTTGFIASDGAILKTTDGGSFWETMPSANGHNFNAIAFIDANNGYAVGDYGVVMKTTNGGGSGFPVVAFDHTSLCLDSIITLTNNSNPAYNFEWQLDGQTFSNSYDTSLNITDGSQSHLISLIVDNGAHTDTQSVVFSAQVGMDINLQTGIFSQLICPYGRDTLFVYNSEPYTSYQSRYNNSTSYWQVGNGGTLTFPIGPNSNDYVASILARKTISGCGTSIDSSLYDVNIVRTNLLTTLSDSVLCKSEPATITLHDPDPGVFYTLRKWGEPFANIYGSSSVATSSTISFETDSIDHAGYYRLVAHMAYGCYSIFTDSLFIEVEETTAKFHASLINAAVGENVQFYENCIDAGNYQWLFSPDASVPNTVLNDPNLSFGSLGPTEVELMCWSNNGCYDTIVATGPTIYQPPSQVDPVWVNNNLRDQASQYTYIYAIHKGRSGFFICGIHRKGTLATQYGDSAKIAESLGGFVAKYDFDGTLKWNINTVDHSTSWTDHITSVAEDGLGNIYFSGKNAAYLIDNAGDSVPLSGADNRNLCKLDSSGRHIWTLSSYGTSGNSSFQIDNSDNLIINGWSGNVTLNGVPWGTFPNQIVKLSPNAELIWNFFASGVKLFDTDSVNNIYISGSYNNSAYFTDASGASVDTVLGTGGSSVNTYLAKYDSTGNFQWAIRGVHEGLSMSYSVGINSIETDAEGNTYLTGLNSCTGSNTTFKFINTDSTETSISAGKYMVAKINTNGVCEWINGVNYSNASYGYDISLYNDEVSVICGGSITGTFTSSNGNGVSLSLNTSDYLVAVYDPSGSLIRISRNGMNQQCVSGSNYVMFQTDDGAYYMARNVNFNSQCGPSYYQFGDEMEIQPLVHTSYVIRFEEDYGVTYLPGYNRVDTILICSGSNYTFPDGIMEQNVNSQVIHSSHFQGFNGLDSTIITLLDTVSFFESEEFVSVCSNGEHSFPDGTSIDSITTQISHISNLSSIGGCDSTVITYVNPIVQSVSQFVYVCVGESYVFPDGTVVNNLTQNVYHSSHLSSQVSACDSVVNTNVFVHPYLFTRTIHTCEGASIEFPDGTVIDSLTQNHIDTSYLTSSISCDSTIITTVILELLDTDLNVTGDTLSTSFFAPSYQWLDCQSGLPMSGATTNMLIVPNDGFYALVLSNYWCTDTTDCYEVFASQPDGILSSGLRTMLNIYPNPTEGVLYIELDKNLMSSTTVELIDASGKIVFIENMQTQLLNIDLKTFVKGVYTCRVISNDGIWVEKVIYK